MQFEANLKFGVAIMEPRESAGHVMEMLLIVSGLSVGLRSLRTLIRCARHALPNHI